MDKLIYLISLLLTFLQIARDGLVIFYRTMVEKSIWLIKNVKKPLLTTLEVIAYVLMMTFALVAFVLMMVLFAIMDNTLDFYSYLFKKRSGYNPRSCLTTSYRLSKIGIRKLKKLLYGLKSHLRLPG